MARPYKSQGNDSGGAKCPCSLGGCEKLIAVWSPAAVLPPRPGLAVAACRAGNEAKITIRILAWVQDPCSRATIFQRSSPVSGHDDTPYDWLSTYHGHHTRDLTERPQRPSWEMPSRSHWTDEAAEAWRGHAPGSASMGGLQLDPWTHRLNHSTSQSITSDENYESLLGFALMQAC